jgi:hypothetical protein
LCDTAFNFVECKRKEKKKMKKKRNVKMRTNIAIRELSGGKY